MILAEFAIGFVFALVVFTMGIGVLSLFEIVSDFVRWGKWWSALFPFIVSLLFGLLASLTPIIELEEVDDGDGVDELKIVIPFSKSEGSYED